MWQELDLLCVQQLTVVSAARVSFGDCGYPTGRSGPSKSHLPPSWDGNEQSRRTSQRTESRRERKVYCETAGGGFFLPEGKRVNHINSTHPGKHQAIGQGIGHGKFCTQDTNFPLRGWQTVALETWTLKPWPCHQIGRKPILRTSLFCGL